MSDRLRHFLAQLNRHIVWSGGACQSKTPSSSLPDDYRAVVSVHDGLIAMEGGLRLFGITRALLPDIATWNIEAGWRSSYRTLADGLLFFAEDAFGDQFAFEGGRLVRFHAETGQREHVSDSLADWLQQILDDPESQLSLPVIREWRRQGNQLQPNQHLCPTYPFVVRGSRGKTLHALDRNESMHFKGDFAWQIKDLPEGTRIKVAVKGK